MSALLTFNAFGLLLVRWIIGPAVVKVENKFCVISAAGIHVWFSFYLTLFYKQIFNLMLNNNKGIFGGLQKIACELKKLFLIKIRQETLFTDVIGGLNE